MSTLAVVGLALLGLRDRVDTQIVASESPAEAALALTKAGDRGPEIDAAITRLRGNGAFIREFHRRDSPEYWVQIISTGLGATTRKSAENFDDAALNDVEIITRGVSAELHLRNTSMTSSGLGRLSSAGRLSMLELSGNNIDETMLEVLLKLPLQGLSLDADSLTDDDLQHLTACKHLASVSLRGRRLTNDCLEFLTGLPKLERVTLAGNTFTWRAFEILTRLENLRDLEVSWQATPLLTDLAKLPKLRRISFSGKENDDVSALAIAKSFEFLEQAYLRQTSITNEGVEHLSGLKNLKTLTLDDAPIDDGVADSIRKMRQLGWLSLDRCAIGDATMAAIAECPDLWFLNLNNTLVTDDGLAALVKLKKLHVLYLSSCKSVTDDSIKSLMKLPDSENLHINVQSSGITEKGARQLQAALPHAQIVWGVPAVPLR